MSTSTETRRGDQSTAEDNRVVVAVGGASSGDGAARWAAAEATRLGLPLQIVGAVPVEPNRAPLHAPDAATMERHSSATRARLESLAAGLSGPTTILPVLVAEGPPVQTILDHLDASTALLVLGHRAQSPVQRLTGGSTSIAVAGRSPVPVTVVPDSWQVVADDHRAVVLGMSLEGIDGAYRTDEDVLTTAFERAWALGAPLQAVHAWQVPALLSWSPADITSFGRRVKEALGEVLEPWVARFPDVELTVSPAAGRPLDVVEDASATAQLVVLGRHTPVRRHGGFHLGSTTREALHHAHAPVLVVPVAQGTHEHQDAAGAGWAPTF